MILGPIALVIGSIISFQYYTQTQNLGMTLLIGISVPFAIKLCGSVIVKSILKADKKEETSSFSFSRFLGGCMSILWSGTIVALLLILVVIAPIESDAFQKLKLNVLVSHSFTIINNLTQNSIPTSLDEFQNIAQVINNPDFREKLEKKDEFKALLTNKAMQELASDPETNRQIQEKDFVSLLKNENFKSIMKDQEMLKQLMLLNKEIFKTGVENNKARREEEASKPKIVEIK